MIFKSNKRKDKENKLTKSLKELVVVINKRFDSLQKSQMELLTYYDALLADHENAKDNIKDMANTIQNLESRFEQFENDKIRVVK